MQTQCVRLEAAMAASSAKWEGAIESCNAACHEQQAELQDASDRVDRLQEQGNSLRAGIEACEHRIGALKDSVPHVRVPTGPRLANQLTPSSFRLHQFL